MSALIEVTELHKVYATGQIQFQALRGISLAIERGDYVAVMGPSGSGKSTLLHLLGGLDRPSKGSVRVGGQELESLDETRLARFRRRNIGFVFQFFNLIDNLTIQTNVELPALLEAGRDREAIRRRSGALLERLGIVDQAPKHPWELSGGQQQRVAIARALINEPQLLLADEPTGNLDSSSGLQVLDILDDFNRQGQTIVVVTHDALAAARARQVLVLCDGNVVDRLPGGDAQAIAQRLATL
jgi:putative ABC transport system ATP-binding protein